LQEIGIDSLKALTTRQIDGKLWEIKFRRHNRLFYILIDDYGIYITHAYQKQKGKAEKKDINTARARIKVWRTENAVQ